MRCRSRHPSTAGLSEPVVLGWWVAWSSYFPARRRGHGRVQRRYTCQRDPYWKPEVLLGHRTARRYPGRLDLRPRCPRRERCGDRADQRRLGPAGDRAGGGHHHHRPLQRRRRRRGNRERVPPQHLPRREVPSADAGARPALHCTFQHHRHGPGDQLLVRLLPRRSDDLAYPTFPRRSTSRSPEGRFLRHRCSCIADAGRHRPSRRGTRCPQPGGGQPDPSGLPGEHGAVAQRSSGRHGPVTPCAHRPC